MSESRKIREIKAGNLLRYKKRIFGSNWRRSEVTLFSNATISTVGSTSRVMSIQMTVGTTLVVFGQQLKDIPKKPILPSGYKMEQLLAIGIICNQLEPEDQNERLEIIFYWFLTSTIHELFDWIVAINNIIPANKQIFTDEELTISLVMAEATHFNNIKLLTESGNNAGNQDHNQASEHQVQVQVNHEWVDQSVPQEYLGSLEPGHQGHGYLGGMEGAESSLAVDCSDFDDCSGYVSADAFAIF